MRALIRHSTVGVGAIAILAAIACGGSSSESPQAAAARPPAEASAPAAGSQAPASAAAGGAMAHGDHTPHHGGIVMMKGELHYEVAPDPSGRHRLYFTDATRADLPATVAQSVTLTIKRAGEADETVSLQVDDAGESWEGRGREVAKPADAQVRVAFTLRGQPPYWIDLPFQAPKPQPTK